MSWDSIKSDSARLLTYQDFVDAGEENREAFALEAIRRHMASESYRVAVDADLYDMQRNPTINKYVQQIFDIIKEINKAGVTILLIEQNANMALKIADKAYVLETGSIVLEGSGEELLQNESVREAYLGKKK